jgi:hypothetical protein
METGKWARANIITAVIITIAPDASSLSPALQLTGESAQAGVSSVTPSQPTK